MEISHNMLHTLGLIILLLNAIAAENWHFEGQNIAYNKTATQHPGSFSNQQASLAVNGELNPNLHSTNCAHTDKATGTDYAWWNVDLGKFYYLKGIKIYNRDKDVRIRLKGFSIIGQTNTGNSTIYGPDDIDNYKRDVIELELNGTLPYKGITIRLPSHRTDSYLTLCEVEIFAIICPVPQDPEHGKYELNNYTITAVCENGYSLRFGKKTRTCLASGSWSGSNPLCVRICKVPQIYHGSFRNPSMDIVSEYFVYYRTYLLIECEIGYRSISHSIQCMDTGQWSNSGKFCQIVTCRLPEQFNNGRLEIATTRPISTRDYTYGTTVSVVCFSGYRANIPRIRCDANGNWTTYPNCLKINCTLPNLVNGFYTDGKRKVETIEFEDFAYPLCHNESFKLSKPGNGSRTCMANGSLFGNTLSCVPLCKLPTGPENGFYVDLNGLQNSAQQGDRLHIQCYPGFEAINASAICQADFSWLGTLPKCTAKQCEVDKLLLDQRFLMIGNDEERTTFNQTLTLQCKTGYMSLNGSSEIRCNEDSKFIYDDNMLQCQEIEKSTSSSVALAGGIGGGCAGVVAALVVVAIILFRRRNGKSYKKSKQHTENSVVKTKNEAYYGNEYSSIDETEMNATPTSGNIYNTVDPNYDQDDTTDYYSFDEEKMPVTAIRVEDLPNIVIKSISSNKRMQEQFAMFRKGMTACHKAAVKTENRTKNKYKDMYPYDENRVVLQSGNLMSETDYINASYIDGFSEPKHYIAAQAPFSQQKTINDFWRMVWQKEVSKIIMLTRFKEEDKVKCDQYWPEKDSEMYGRVQVTLQKTENFSEFVVRHFLVLKDNSSKRKLVHFHFTAWPDKGVPKYASSLVHFREKAMNTPTNTKGPIVVHCSAGVGRTGTFIALDILAEQGARLGYVDVYGCIQNLRKQRVLMVQTLDQYVFIHVALTEALMLSPSVLPASKFIETYRDALCIDPETGKRRIDIEFEMLLKLSPTTEESQYISATDVQNRKKNRYANILPVDEFMPRFSEGEHYINAVFLPSYKEKNSFIITQSPLTTTKQEFWKLVYDHKVRTIVMMNSVTELKSEEEIYWPHNSAPVKFDKLSVSYIGEQEESGHNITTLEMKQSEKARQIKILQFCHFMEDEFPGRPEYILSMIELVQNSQSQSGGSPVVVHCMNGADKSGLYCVISAVIERLKIEQDVAISQTIEIMRNCREQLIISLEQFKFCHDVVLTFINQFETYSNFAEVHA